jgi:hypothetical protein
MIEERQRAQAALKAKRKEETKLGGNGNKESITDGQISVLDINGMSAQPIAGPKCSPRRRRAVRQIRSLEFHTLQPGSEQSFACGTLVVSENVDLAHAARPMRPMIIWSFLVSGRRYPELRFSSYWIWKDYHIRSSVSQNDGSQDCARRL